MVSFCKKSFLQPPPLGSGTTTLKAQKSSWEHDSCANKYYVYLKKNGSHQMRWPECVLLFCARN